MTDFDYDGEHLTLTSKLVHKDRCKQIPGMRWDPDNSVWRCKATWSAALAIVDAFPEINVSDAARDWSDNYLNNIVAPASALRAQMTGYADDHPVATLRGQREHDLYGFQEWGATFLHSSKYAGLFDPMGTGKTAQALSALALAGEQSLPALIVCPNSVKASWLREISVWWPQANAVDFGNTAPARRKAIAAIHSGDANVLVVNWESLAKNSRLAGYGSIKITKSEREEGPLNTVEWRAVVADEAHRSKSPKAKQTRALWWLGQQSSVNYRFALTGTPQANNAADLWSILHFLRPAEFPSRTKFIDAFFLFGYGHWGGIEILGIDPTKRQSFEASTDYLWRRTPKEIALPQLPAKVYSERSVRMSIKQARLYREMAATYIAELESGEAIIASNAITRLTRMIQFASASATINDDGDVTLQSPSNKVDELVHIVDEMNGRPLVVFAMSRQLIELCAERLDDIDVTYGLVTGRQTPDMRAKSVDEFQDGKLQVMLCTLAAGGTGITLTAADTLVFLQKSFNLVDNLQAEDRVHRIGSEDHNSVHIITVTTTDSVDRHVTGVADMKSEGLEALVRDKDRLKSLLSGADI